MRTARDVAERRFVLERKGEGPDLFHAACATKEKIVREALALTSDLRQLHGDALLRDPQLWQTLRYFAGPPISEEDLWTLVGRKFKRVAPEFADKTAEALLSVIDSWRFPWLGADRVPTSSERERAITASTLLIAYESLKTERRGRSSQAQEFEVSSTLVSAGLTLDNRRTPIIRLDELARGEFSRERKVDGAKCDVPVRLRDGRLLALECKVSNGPKNSWKRLQREVGGKSERWQKEFGSQVITGAVLAGVFDLTCLVNAQNDQGVLLFWQHDLSALGRFVLAATG